MAARQTQQQPKTEEKPDGEKGKKGAKRSKNPFRGVLERMAEDRGLKVELDILDEDAEVSDLVRDPDTGDIYSVKLQRVREGDV